MDGPRLIWCFSSTAWHIPQLHEVADYSVGSWWLTSQRQVPAGWMAIHLTSRRPRMRSLWWKRNHLCATFYHALVSDSPKSATLIMRYAAYLTDGGSEWKQGRVMCIRFSHLNFENVWKCIPSLSHKTGLFRRHFRPPLWGSAKHTPLTRARSSSSGSIQNSAMRQCITVHFGLGHPCSIL